MSKNRLHGDFAGEKTERVVLVKLLLDKDEASAMASLEELERLTESAGGEVAAKMTQSREKPDAATYIGSGKIAELSELCKNAEITLVVFDCELSPSQIKNIEDAMESDVRVIDRSMLILDIFALHASSGEGKLQVELAQLKYTVPRLIGKGAELSRQGGGFIAARGPGESKLETDRRHIQRRVATLERQINELDKNRRTQRTQRERSGICKVTVAGYTNAGKSTLLNYLTGAGILAQDKLFATLDPTTRRLELPSGKQVLLTDTVGFIRNLPHHFISAFRSTLDEVKYADVIILLADGSDKNCESQTEVTKELLEQLSSQGKPILYAYNKCDMIPRDGDGNQSLPYPGKDADKEDVFYISAKTGKGIPSMLNRLDEIVVKIMKNQLK